jgi:hypothetical protein
MPAADAEDLRLRPLGLDPARLRQQSRMLCEWIQSLDKARIAVMGRNFERMQVVEQTIGDFRAARPHGSAIMQAAGETLFSSVQVAHIFRAHAPAVPFDAEPTLGERLDMQNAQGQCYREAREKGVTEIAVSSAFSCPPEAFARAAMQAALLELGRDDLRLDRLVLCTGDLGGQTRPRFEALKAVWRAALDELTLQTGGSVSMQQPRPKPAVPEARPIELPPISDPAGSQAPGLQLSRPQGSHTPQICPQFERSNSSSGSDANASATPTGPATRAGVSMRGKRYRTAGKTNQKAYVRARSGGLESEEAARQTREITQFVPNVYNSKRAYYGAILDFRENNPTYTDARTGCVIYPSNWDARIMKGIPGVSGSSASEVHRRRRATTPTTEVIREYMKDAPSTGWSAEASGADKARFAYNSSRDKRNVWTLSRIAKAAELSGTTVADIAHREDLKGTSEVGVVRDHVKDITGKANKYRAARVANIKMNWGYTDAVLEVGAEMDPREARKIRKAEPLDAQGDRLTGDR